MKKALWTGVPVAAAALALALPTAALAAGSVSVSPASGLKDGQSVSVKGSGFPASTTIYVLQCANLTGQAGCDLAHLTQAQSDASGAISATLVVHTGTVGNGTCDADHPCYISAGDAAQTASGNSKITFTGASTTAATSGTDTTSTGAAAAPTTVNAGSGGGADRDGLPVTTLVLGLVGGAAVVVGGAKLVRR